MRRWPARVQCAACAHRVIATLQAIIASFRQMITGRNEASSSDMFARIAKQPTKIRPNGGTASVVFSWLCAL